MSLATYPSKGRVDPKVTILLGRWIAWAPFVGLFVARISRGRTIKEFVLGVLLVPSLLVFLWFSAFGGSALHLQLQGVNIAQVATADAPIALFVFFDHFPLGDIMSALTSVLLVVFFVTSADSATYVLGMLTSQGNLFPPTSKKVIWGLAESLIAALLLLAGGLKPAAMVINAALPFTFVMVLLCYTLARTGRETALTEFWARDLSRRLAQLGFSKPGVTGVPANQAFPSGRSQPPWQFRRLITHRRTLASCAGRNDLMRHRIGKHYILSVGDDRVKLPASTVCGVVPRFARPALLWVNTCAISIVASNITCARDSFVKAESTITSSVCLSLIAS